MPPKRKTDGGERFAYNGTTERMIDNFNVCFLTSVPEENSGTPQQLVIGAKCRISFRARDPYRAHIEISILAPRSTDRDIFHTPYLRLDALCLAKNDLASMDIDDYKKICHEEGRLDEDAHCYQLVLEFDGKKLCTENIFTDHCPDYATNLRDYLRANSKMAVYLSGLATIATNWDQLVARFTQDRKNNPMLAHYPTTMSGPLIREGLYLKSADRPVKQALAPVRSFFDWPDYMTRNGFGLIYEHEHTKNIRDSFEVDQHEMVFFELVNGTSRRVMFFLYVSDTATEVRLRPNNRLNVFFDEERDITKAWSATITDPLTYSPRGSITGHITGSRGEEDMRYRVDYKPPRLPAKVLEQLKKAPGGLMDQTRHKVGLSIIDSRNDFSRRISALEHMNLVSSSVVSTIPRQKEEVQFLIGNDFNQARKVDIYESVSNKQPNLESVMFLNHDQAQAVAAARHTPGGYLLIHGGPGTGKSYLIGEMCKPFLVDEEHHRILICSANNIGADNAAVRAHQVLTQLQKDGIAPAKKYVLRLHSYETEKTIMENDTKKARTIPKRSCAPSMRVFSEEELDIVGQLDIAKLIHEENQQPKATSSQGTDDELIVEHEISLGYRMLQVAGLVLDKEGMRFPWASDVNDAEVRGFIRSYMQYRDGVDMDGDLFKAFKYETKRLAKMTISCADVVASTLATASNAQIAEAYKQVEGIFIDDAARIPESANWPIIERFGVAGWKVLVGDPFQLSPVVQSTPETNPFIAQMKLSQMHRLMNAGASAIFLAEQTRAVPEIAEPYNQVIYHNRLTHAPSTALEVRPIAQAMRAFNRGRFNIDANIVYLDLVDSESCVSATGSTYNEKSCRLILNLVEELLNKQIDGNNICILSPYHAQYRCFTSGLEMMSKVHPQVNTLIDNDKVDRRQGSEFSTVIVDLTRSEGSGFLRDKARLNVLFSRAQNALYVVGSKKCIDKLNYYPGMFLMKFQSHFLSHCVHLGAPSYCQWYSRGQVDVTEALEADGDFGGD